MTLASADALGFHASGKIRALATSGPERSIVLPDVPTFCEQGFDIEGYGWYAIYGPAGMSDET
jgi:tripartite-type tricarboxylate transporter receptor subunit TctC